MKAIIMAGGEGTRLRPLTCDCPKPMIRLMNRPVMQYALALLKKHGITRVAATLGYLPDAIRDYFAGGDAFGVSMRYFVEHTPLGTAGGVKQAAGFLDETFVVLSGDGVTDLDLSAAIAFHRRKSALATLVLKRTDNPLDYGVVLTDAEGRVRAFREKPDWGDVISDTVNTGIYILEPDALRRIPEGCASDFGHDLFPELVRQGLPVYGYVMQGYWCDIGDVRAYLAAHQDAMEGRIRVDGLLPRQRVAQLPGAQVDRAAVLEGPCLIGAGARLLAGAYVGPYSVVGDGCVIGEGASVKRAVLWPGARLLAGAQARGCVLASGASLGERAQAYEEGVLGTGAALGERAVLLPGVRLWPGKRGLDGERLDANRVWGGPERAGFTGDRLAAEDPAAMARAAQAVCAVLKPRELLLGRDPGGAAEALWHAAAAGAMAQGVRVVDAGVCPIAPLRHAQRALRCDCAALVAPDGLTPLNARGARLFSGQRRAVAARLARQDFPPPFSAGQTPPVEVFAAATAYVADAAARFAADPASAPPVALYADSDPLRDLAERCLLRAGLFCRIVPAPGEAPGPGELGVCVTEGGERCALADEGGALDEAERQLLLAWTALERGERALLLPPQATRAIQALAARYDAGVEYLSGETGAWMNALAERFPEQFALQSDGIIAALSALDALAAAGLTLTDWRRAMPAVARSSRSVPVSPSRTGRVLRAMAGREPNAQLGGGMRFTRDEGWAWICPDDSRPEFHIVAEAARAETAEELCDFCEAELRRLAAKSDSRRPDREPAPPS